MSGKRRTFTAEIMEGRGGGAFIEIPFDVKAAYGTGGQVKVTATFDGEPYRGSLAPMGGGKHVLGLRKSIREALAKGVGDKVTVVVEPDTAPRVVIVPADLKKVLAGHPVAAQRFRRMSYTHQKEYVQWVEDAKRPETRARRLAKTIEMLADGKTR